MEVKEVQENTSNLIYHENCPLCHATAKIFLQKTQDLHYGIPGYWDYSKCSDCRVVFLNPAPTQDFLKNSYDDSYYSYQDFSPPKIWRLIFRRLLGFNVGNTGDPVFLKPGKVLDIGCGSGQFLYDMKKKGWETHGVELSTGAAEIGNHKYELNIQSGSLLDAQLPLESFDYIRLNHSFEHLTNPRETLQRIERLLKVDGLLFIGVPNVNSIQARIFGRYWWNLGPPVHPFNYSHTTLKRLLSESGFEMTSYRTYSNFSGILGSIQMAWNYRYGIDGDVGWIIRNPVAKILTHWVARMTDLFDAGDCLELIAHRRKK